MLLKLWLFVDGQWSIFSSIFRNIDKLYSTNLGLLYMLLIHRNCASAPAVAGLQLPGHLPLAEPRQPRQPAQAGGGHRRLVGLGQDRLPRTRGRHG